MMLYNNDRFKTKSFVVNEASDIDAAIEKSFKKNDSISIINIKIDTIHKPETNSRYETVEFFVHIQYTIKKKEII